MTIKTTFGKSTYFYPKQASLVDGKVHAYVSKTTAKKIRRELGVGPYLTPKGQQVIIHTGKPVA